VPGADVNPPAAVAEAEREGSRRGKANHEVVRLLLGLIVGVTATYCATAYGHGSKGPAGPESVVCSKFAGTAGFECTYPNPPGVKTAYGIRIPGLDLACDVRGPGGGLPEGMTCRRQSRGAGSCDGGALGSLSVYVSSTSVAVSTPNRCVNDANVLGFRVTRVGHLTRFARNP
jgi:hypothetical protein